MIINENLVEIKVEGQNKEAIIRLLSNRLGISGFVSEGFEEAVLERERQYPTGLPTKIPVALCHVEADYVKETALAIAILNKPVEFHNMGDPENVLNVDIVFLLTILDPKKQVFYLRKLMELFKNDTLPKLKAARSKKEVVSILSKNNL